MRSIEHGDLIDETSVELLVEKGAFLVPTLVTYDAVAPIKRDPNELGVVLDSAQSVLAGMLRDTTPSATGSNRRCAQSMILPQANAGEASLEV